MFSQVDIPYQFMYTRFMDLNPYKAFRIFLNLTQLEVSHDLKITRQVILNTEMGLYHLPSPKITEFYRKYLPQIIEFYTYLEYEDGLAKSVDQYMPQLCIWYDTSSNKTGPVAGNKFEQLYSEWVVRHRREAKDAVLTAFLGYLRVGPNPQYTGFRRVRRAVMAAAGATEVESRAGFCKLLCLQPSMLDDYEGGDRGQLPNWLTKALLDTGVDMDIIESVSTLLGHNWG